MKKQLLIIVTSFFSIALVAQNAFVQGYFIDNADQKIICKIKTVDWNNNPKGFEYITSDGVIIKTNIDDVSEFGVDNVAKYIRAKVDIDRSTEDINNLSGQRNPTFDEEVLYLKVILESKASLYQYLDNGLTRYFYKVDDSDITQLVFKSYFIAESKISKNVYYRQQILNDLKSACFGASRIKNVGYNKRDLSRIFTEYNNCFNQESTFIEKKVKRDIFNLNVRPRINLSSLTVQIADFQEKDVIDFGRQTTFGVGFEAELILPFNKNKWSFIFEPTFQSYRSETINNDISVVFGGTIISSVEYATVEIPLGLRHYFYLNNNSAIFINASYIFDLDSGSNVTFQNPLSTGINTVDIDATSENFGFGIGYKTLDKYILELRQQTSRDLFVQSGRRSSDYKTFSIIFGYSFF